MALQEPFDTRRLQSERIGIDHYLKLLRNALVVKYGKYRESVTTPGDSTVVPLYLFKTSPETLPYGSGYYDLPAGAEDPLKQKPPRGIADLPPRYFGLALPGIQVLTRIGDLAEGAPETATRWLDPEKGKWSAWEAWWVNNAVLFTNLTELEKHMTLFC